MPRRAVLGLLSGAALCPLPTLAQAVAARESATPTQPPVIRPDTVLRFPQDHGSHPAYRTEWWYATGWLQVGAQPRPATDQDAAPMGFQITFFRSRVDAAAGSSSAFAATQLLFAHAALTDPQAGKLLHRQRMARSGFQLAQAATHDTDVHIRDWRLTRQTDGAYAVRLPNSGRAVDDFGYDLQLAPTQPVLLQGQAGYSRKGPQPEQASHYYSQPQLAVHGHLLRGTQRTEVHGRAWLDHEWSEELLHPQAQGWDWIGMNLFDGSALTAFRLRTANGKSLWAGGSFRAPGGNVRAFGPDDVRFTAQAHWTSPATGARYPVTWMVQTPAGVFTVQARLDAQELDSRGNTGAIYWEGLSDLLDGQGRIVGRGYLEMTGYAAALRL